MISLLLGGAGSGKSVLAERRAARLPGPVTYVATWVPTGLDVDEDMARRVAAHQARRPTSWSLREVATGALAPTLAALAGTILVDALGTWIAGAPDFRVDVPALCAALTTRPGDTVIVSDEVGLGVHPSSEAGRRFRDALGAANQAVAVVADEVWLVVAGRVVPLETTASERAWWDR